MPAKIKIKCVPSKNLFSDLYIEKISDEATHPAHEIYARRGLFYGKRLMVKKILPHTQPVRAKAFSFITGEVEAQIFGSHDLKFFKRLEALKIQLICKYNPFLLENRKSYKF